MQRELRSARFFNQFFNRIVLLLCDLSFQHLHHYNGIFTGNQESLYNLYTKNTIIIQKGESENKERKDWLCSRLRVLFYLQEFWFFC